MARQALRLTIQGYVQGVGYRAWAQGAANRLDLCGWVRNRRDGSVELVAIGEARALDDFAKLCERGPLGSKVEAVQRHPAEDDGAQEFQQRDTA